MTCDVCGLPDYYRGQGDGIGSCDCPRCDCGAAAGSYLCDCPPDDCDDPDCDCHFGDDGEPWPDDVVYRPIETINLPGVS
ncbi:hypothetical protein [Micromonospora sp. 4G55]|uniref:hypothetical protein n=1 Tax=Micromonospora sp. 4G55 TaxID=2806102 RepID=UPI001A3C241F|nr:hypothetical protein [Micromonospora sp. 4G55]MBM0257364.1 hypothetical protein [Micromonospora sp. 4G55]